METLQIRHPERETYEAIMQYFGKVRATVNVYMYGAIVEAEITYYDFKPLRVVRREIEDRFPRLNISQLRRLYSNEADMTIMREMLDADEEIYLPSESGDTVRKVTMHELVAERMYCRTI